MLVSLFFLLVLILFLLAGYLGAMNVQPKVWIVAYLAFLLRAIWAIANDQLHLITPADEPGYHLAVQHVAEQFWTGNIFAIFNSTNSPGHSGLFIELYSAVLGPIYVIFGSEMVFIRLMMAFFGTLAIINIYLICRQLHTHQAGLYSAVVATAFPYWIYLSGLLYRDMLVVFLFTLLGYGIVRWQRNTNDYTAVVVTLVSVLFVIGLRTVNIIAVSALLAGLLYAHTEQCNRRILYLAVVGVAAVGLMYAVFGQSILIEYLADRRLWLSRSAPGAYLTGFAYKSPIELLFFLPIGAIYFMLVPFPWQTINSMALLAIGQNLFMWYPVLGLSLIGFRDVAQTSLGGKMLLPLCAFSLAGIFGYGLVEGNIGPAMRHRSQFQFIFFILAGVAIENRLRIRI